jgi:hypothetical protein
MLRQAIIIAAVTISPSAAFAQVYAVQVDSLSMSPDLTVSVVTLIGDETWEVVGECRNAETSTRVRFDFLSLSRADIRVVLVRRGQALIPNRQICITNADTLSDTVREQLKLPPRESRRY